MRRSIEERDRKKLADSNGNPSYSPYVVNFAQTKP
jgi:hypothetical protein